MIPNPNLTERLQRKQRGCQQFHFVPPLLVLPYSNNILHHYLIFVSKGSHLVYMRKDFHMLSNGSNRKQCKRENAFSVRREGYQVSRSAGTRQFPLPNIKRTERTLEKQFAVNAHPTWVGLHLKSSDILPKIISCITTGFCEIPKDMMDKTPPNSKTPLCYKSFHTCPSLRDCGKSVQEMPSGWQHWDPRCPSKTFLNIALVVYSPVGSSRSSSSPAVCLHLPLGPQGKTTDRLVFVWKPELGSPKYMCWEKAQPPPSFPMVSEFTIWTRKQKGSKRSLCPGSNSRS